MNEPTYTQQLVNWGKRYNLTLMDVIKLRRLINRHIWQQTRFCNGDPHPSVSDKSDQNANSAAWSVESDQTDVKLDALAKSLGFDRVDYGVGLVPALEKDGDTCIMVPL